MFQFNFAQNEFNVHPLEIHVYLKDDRIYLEKQRLEYTIIQFIIIHKFFSIGKTINNFPLPFEFQDELN